MNRNFFPSTAAVILLSGASVASFAQARNISFEAGTVIPVKLESELSSKENRSGDKFTVKIVTDKTGYSDLPEGSVIEGTIREAKAKSGNNPGMLDLNFSRIRLANGRTYPISGALIGLDEKSVETNEDGVLVAKGKAKNNRLTYLGYGAGAGVLASIIGAGGKIRIENILLGAGLGYLAGSLEKNKKDPSDVTLKEGTDLGVRLDKRLSLARYTGTARDNRDRNTSDDGFAQGENGGSNLDRPRNSDRTDRNDPLTSGTEVGVLVDDRDVTFSGSARPQVVSGVVLVPVRPVLDSLKSSFRTTENANTLEATLRGNRVKISNGSRIAIVNGTRRVRLETTVRRLNGTMVAPAQFFDLLTGTKREWDSESKTLTLTSK